MHRRCVKVFIQAQDQDGSVYSTAGIPQVFRGLDVADPTQRLGLNEYFDAASHFLRGMIGFFHCRVSP